MNKKYFGGFDSRDDIISNFGAKVFPPEEAILFAAYGGYSYEGAAIVVFESDGKLFEVNGGHCSCHGLEGQWEPEETSWEALAMRKDLTDEYESDARAAFASLVASRVPFPGATT